MRRAAGIVLLATVAVAGAALWSYHRRDYRPVFSRVAGELVAVRDSTGVGRAADGKAITEVTLVSDSGLRVRLRVRAEGEATGVRHPAALIVGGLERGRRAVDVPSESVDLVLASIEYPYEGPRDHLTPWGWIRRFPEMRQAALETPSALLLAAQYLYARDDVDPDRVTAIGASLGVPFVVSAAATDSRIAGVVLLHGGGDIDRIVSHAWGDAGGRWGIAAMATAFDWALAPLEPTKYVDDIAPRPLLMVNARGDEFIPEASARSLYRRARRPKRLVWLDSPHVRGGDAGVVRSLVRIALRWMEERGLR